MKRVLVVDDSESVRLVAKAMIQKHFKASVDYVAQLGAAKAAMEFTSYDVVFLDLNLPDSDSRQTLAEVANIQSTYPRSRIIIWSSDPPSKRELDKLGLAGLRILDKCDISAFRKELSLASA